jgi:hypothetical protein
MHELGDQSLAALDDFLVGKRRLSQGSECKAQTKGIIEITKCGCESWKAKMEEFVNTGIITDYKPLLDDVIIVKNGFRFEQGLHLDVIPFCSGMIHFPQECLAEKQKSLIAKIFIIASSPCILEIFRSKILGTEK